MLDDVDLGNRRLTIAGRVRPLDDLTSRLLLDWLEHRRLAEVFGLDEKTAMRYADSARALLQQAAERPSQ
ncbi:hypothetical protein [Streptomyces sp. AGS-58]|uniref:hypothetical protein n=1 Tax=unclassified Streptomyces TaxID=2593676 RepID=UPI0035A3A510